MAPCIGPCQFMATRHGTISPTLRAGVRFLGGWGGMGGGGGGCREPPPSGVGGCAGGSFVRRGQKNPAASPGHWAPSRTNLGFARGDSAMWYGMVWYGMVWYGMVWYGMVWYGMVWCGVVWCGMVRYGTVRYGTVRYVVVVVVVVGALSTCRREKLPDTLSLGRAQGSSRPALHWLGGRRRRPREGGGGGPPCRGGGCVRAWRRVGPPVDVTLEPSPAAGGRVTRPVRSGGGGGARWRDHLSGDMRGPDSPCFEPPLPRDRGGDHSCAEVV